MPAMNKLLSWTLTSALCCLLLACASSTTGSATDREFALTEYGAAIRWSQFDAAQGFIAPAALAANPMTDLEIERLKQIQVTGYEVKSHVMNETGEVRQTVEIRLISKNTQLERTVTDHQTWSWDPVAGRLWLTSGLPDFTAQ